MDLFRTFVFITIVNGMMLPNESASAQQPPAAERLHAIFDAEWEWTLRERPTFASHLGDSRYNHLWPDVSLSAFERRHKHKVDVLKQLDAIQIDSLSPADRLNYQLFRDKYETDIEAHAYRWYLVPLTQRDGIQDANSLADALPFEAVKDYEDWIARLRGFPAYMDQTIALMRKGTETGTVHPEVVMRRVPTQIVRQIVGDPGESLFLKPFRNFPAEIDAADRQRLITDAKNAVAQDVVPAFRRFHDFFEKEYLPACYPQVGAWQIPNGREFYAFRARKFTTTDLTPEEIHALGLQEIQRIRHEMEKVIQQVEFKGTFDEFLEFLRSDPQFYYSDSDELLKAYRDVAKRIDPLIVKLFGKLPRVPYGVEPIPMHIAPDTTTAYYRQPSADGSRAGTYFVNVYKPEKRPKYEMEVLSVHEAVPGHHLQIGLAMELPDLPAFRRLTGYTAFVEGWGLYSESLGDELGLYQDPYSKFGQLTYEMWRAVRLVVDTGMHHFRWTRQQAIDVFLANTAKTRLDIENEVDRYIAWPGQALAYKIGELKIKELRARAERELGSRFDIRQFHDKLLSHGAIPLDVLEKLMNDWIEKTKRS